MSSSARHEQYVASERLLMREPAFRYCTRGAASVCSAELARRRRGHARAIRLYYGPIILEYMCLGSARTLYRRNTADVYLL